MSATISTPNQAAASAVRPRGRNYARHYWLFALPAALVVAAVVVFPWLFTLFMSVHDWKVNGDTPFVGMANYAKMLVDDRFQGAIRRTLYFIAALVVTAPVLLLTLLMQKEIVAGLTAGGVRGGRTGGLYRSAQRMTPKRRGRSYCCCNLWGSLSGGWN